MIRAVSVGIPARNEQDLVGRCLASVGRAIAEVSGDVAVSVVLAADSCTDQTVAIAERFGFVRVIEVFHGNVGAARAAAIDSSLVSDSDLHSTWIACTDADSVVPRDWLSAQLEDADSGIDLTIGTVRPTFDELSAEQIEEWSRTHVRGRPNGHVHGANLGVRAEIYCAVGGFRALAEHEDNDLVDRLRAPGIRALATDRYEVETSGRLFGRTDGGYAAFLRDLRSPAVIDRTRLHPSR